MMNTIIGRCKVNIMLCHAFGAKKKYGGRRMGKVAADDIDHVDQWWIRK